MRSRNACDAGYFTAERALGSVRLPRNFDSVRSSYDAVADEYAAQFSDELRWKPIERALLTAFAEEVSGIGRPVADVGCGPGHVTRFLRDLGLPVFGLDLSARMVAVAHRQYPDLQFVQASLLTLPAQDEAWAGIVALYSVIHLPPDERPVAWGEVFRVLAPGGSLLVSFHVGTERTHADAWLGSPVTLDGYFMEPHEVSKQLEAAGLMVEATLERRGLQGRELPTLRAYVLARKPSADRPSTIDATPKFS